MGKSIFSIALAVKLARDGNSVALVDLDLGAANLHTYLGIRDPGSDWGVQLRTLGTHTTRDMEGIA